MTAPLSVTSASPAPLPPAPSAPGPIGFALDWLLANASPALQYRAMVDVARLSREQLSGLDELPYASSDALQLAVCQRVDGTWGSSMLGMPGNRNGWSGVGTISAVRRLLEYGWDAESPPLRAARRLLFRLLAEDQDPAFLFEFAGKGAREIEILRRGRTILREAAAAALAQAGYEGDPRLRGAAGRIMDKLANFLRSPLSQKPWTRIGNRHVLAAEASPPSIYALQMLSFMPHFRNEHHDTMDRLYRYLEQPQPRQESVQLVGTAIVEQPHLVLGDPLSSRNVVDADVPFALMWLETAARMNFLRRHDGWCKQFERLLDERDRAGVWHPPRSAVFPKTPSAMTWHCFPLNDHSPDVEHSADVTFRLGLIARLSGRPIEVH